MRERLLASWVSLAVCALATGCGDDGPAPGVDPPPPTVTGRPTATELAPSQVAVSTVAPPAGPPPCDVATLEFTAASEGIIVIRNAGSSECEVDVSQSPERDPLMEPSIWLEPGAEGELAVAPSDAGCEQPATVTRVELVVNGEPVAAPLSLPPSCGVLLTAIYTAD